MNVNYEQSLKFIRFSAFGWWSVWVCVPHMPSHGVHYAGLLGTGALIIGVYACVLYQRKLQIKRHKMYMDAIVHTLDVMLKARSVVGSCAHT